MKRIFKGVAVAISIATLIAIATVTWWSPFAEASVPTPKPRPTVAAEGCIPPCAPIASARPKPRPSADDMTALKILHQIKKVQDTAAGE